MMPIIINKTMRKTAPPIASPPMLSKGCDISSTEICEPINNNITPIITNATIGKIIFSYPLLILIHQDKLSLMFLKQLWGLYNY